jgi:hypothetical protein
MQEESSLPGWIVVYAMLAKLCDCAGLHPAPYAHNLRWLMLRLHAGHHCRPLLHRLWPRRMCKQVQCMRLCNMIRHHLVTVRLELEGALGST